MAKLPPRRRARAHRRKRRLPTEWNRTRPRLLADMRLIRTIVMLAALGSLGCGIFEQSSVAEIAVGRFHQLFNEASYSVIYNEADASFSRTTTVPDFDDLLTSVQRNLGLFKGARRTSLAADDPRVSLVYASQFANGSGTEQFAYVIRGGKAYLVS